MLGCWLSDESLWLWVYGGKYLLKSQVLNSELNTERVIEDASGDSGDGEDDELPCVIGKSARDVDYSNSPVISRHVLTFFAFSRDF